MASSADVMVQESFVRFMREQHVLRSTLQARGASCQACLLSTPCVLRREAPDLRGASQTRRLLT